MNFLHKSLHGFYAVVLVAATTLAQGATDTFSSSGNWTAPAGVSSITVEVWGGGGAGGGATSNPGKGGGGAGGQYARKVVTVTPGSVYPYAVGVGGTGSTGGGGSGGDSTFNTNVVVAKGGAGGGVGAANGAAGIGAATGGVGDLVYAGGSGAAGSVGGNCNSSGSGGGGAGSTGAGGNASGNTGGGGTVSGGGAGGNGSNSSGDGSLGASAGGGGAGACAESATDRLGGAGAVGKIAITYSIPTVTTQAATSVTNAGATLNGLVSSNSYATTATFEYGLTASYGSTVTVPGGPLAAGGNNTAVAAAIAGLTEGVLYHFRLNGIYNGSTVVSGADQTFTTLKSLTKTASAASATQGDVITFTVTQSNFTGAVMNGVTITDTLPVSMTYGASAVTLGSVTVSGQTVTWTIPSIPAGGSAQLTLAVTLTQTGVLTNTVSSSVAASASASVLVVAGAVTHFRLDETSGSWTGAAGEVIDSGTTGLHGRRVVTTSPTTTNVVVPSPTIASQYSAVVGGFCNAAQFDGKGVVEVADSTLFDYGQTLSASAWIYPTAYPTSDLYSILSNDVNYEFHLNTTGKLYWWWNAATLTSAATIPLNQWTHIAITFNSATGRQRIYVNGVQDSNTNNWTGTLQANFCKFYIGGDVATGSCALLPARNFRGKIDEVKLYNTELSAAEVQANMTLGRSCSGTYDHIRIEHDASASVCTPETVTIKACLNASCSTLYPGTVTVAMSSTGWVGGDTFTFSGGVASKQISKGTAGTLVLGTNSASPLPAGSTRCFSGSTETCNLVFTSASCSFDAVETGAAAQTRLFTKLAGTAFNVDVLALSSGTTINTTYTGSVTVDLVDSSSSSCPTGTGLSGTSQSVTFVGGNSGRKPVAITYAQAAPNVRVRMKAGSAAAACSTDNFAIRPTTIALATTPAMATPPSASAAVTVRAGSAFTLNATTSAGYTATVALDTAKLTAQITTQDSTVASGGVVGTLTPASLAVNALTTPTNNASYSEVGYVYLAAGAFKDETFTAVDQPAGCTATSTPACDCVIDTTSNNNFSDSLVDSKYGCHIGNSAVALGRFIPDRFTVTPGTPVAACTAHPAAAGAYVPADFTYFSQVEGFGTPFTLTAWNAATTPAATENYAGKFARISAAGWTWTNTTAATGLRFGTNAALPAGAVLAVATASGVDVVPSGSWTNGSVALTSVKHQINRPTALINETAVVVTALPKDADGVTMAAAGAISGATALRYGRLRVQNMYGSERLPMAVPLLTQYRNGGNWVSNADDSCTTVSVPVARTLSGSATPDGLANLYFYPLVANKNQLSSTDTTVTTTSPLVGGASALNFSRPAKAGWLDIILDAPPYLRADWGNCKGQSGAVGLMDDLPCAQVTFGVYKSPLIYRRENY
jgi:uncharacterized repeat protein (TIGR01451 family)